MMTAAEKRKFLGSLGALMDEYTGRVTGTMELTFVATAPDGDDEDIQLTFPDWACITSTQGWTSRLNLPRYAVYRDQPAAWTRLSVPL